MRFTSRDVKQLFPPEERTIIPVPLTDISTRNVILLRRFSTRLKNIVKLQLVMTSWQKFLRPLYVWLLHLSGFDKRFADTPYIPHTRSGKYFQCFFHCGVGLARAGRAVEYLVQGDGSS